LFFLPRSIFFLRRQKENRRKEKGAISQANTSSASPSSPQPLPAQAVRLRYAPSPPFVLAWREGLGGIKMYRDFHLPYLDGRGEAIGERSEAGDGMCG